METVLWVLNALSTAEGFWAIGRFIGLRWVARQILARRRRIVSHGFEFFETRNTLEKKRSWPELIRSAEEIEGMLLIGDNVTRQSIDLHKFKRLLLPYPDSASVINLDRLLDNLQLRGLIRNSTNLAKEKHLNIRWADEFLGYSFLIFDKNSDDARIHVEFILPPMKASDRPSMTIWRKRFPKAFTEFRNAFDELWENASDPDVYTPRATTVAPSQEQESRSLSKEQKVILADELKGRGWTPDNLGMRYASACDQCKKYAMDLMESLSWAGWNGESGVSWDEIDELTGLRIVVEDINKKPAGTILLASALRAADIDFDWWQTPSMGENNVLLWVYRVKQ